MKHTSCVLMLGALVASSIATGQAQTTPQFEVASVRPNKSGSRYVTLPSEYPGGRFQAINVEFRCLIYYAFALEGPKRLGEGRPACTGLEERRLQSLNIVEGLPAWADERFDIVAKGPGNTALSS